MGQFFQSLSAKRRLLFPVLAWILLWLLPWGRLPSIQSGSILAFVTDMLRLCTAMVAFILPGTCLYLLLVRGKPNASDATGIVPIGFTLSVSLIAVLGLLGRLMGLPFTVVISLFAILGIAALALLVRRRTGLGALKDSLQEFAYSILANPAVILALWISVLMVLTYPQFFIDDTSYGAYITNWQSSLHLGFRNLVYSGDALEQPRFWLALYPMGQALLSWLSGVSALTLLSNYLELLLVPIAVIAGFWLARSLGFSPRAAGVAALVQVSLYVWMQGDQWPVGFWFFTNMSEDKVTAVFIIAPVFLVIGMRCLTKPSIPISLLLVLIGFGLALTHPVSEFYAGAILCAIAVLAGLVKKANWRAIGLVAGICALVLLPNAIIRLSPSVAMISVPFEADAARQSFQSFRYLNVVNHVFYGLNPGVLQFFDISESSPAHPAFQFIRLIPVYVWVGGALLAALRLKRGLAQIYIVACASLVAFATVPLTGWILGYFVSARLISRASWFAPLGLAAVVILQALRHWRKNQGGLPRPHQATFRRDVRPIHVGALTCLIIGVPLLFLCVAPLIPANLQTLDHNKQLAQIGNYIDSQSPQPVTAIALNYDDDLRLPTASSEARLISFREEVDYNPHNLFLPLGEVLARKSAAQALRALDPALPDAERCTLIQKYALKFVVAPRVKVTEFQRYVAHCSARVVAVFATQDLTLLELK